jgi:hypothetical protein
MMIDIDNYEGIACTDPSTSSPSRYIDILVQSGNIGAVQQNVLYALTGEIR